MGLGCLLFGHSRKLNFLSNELLEILSILETTNMCLQLVLLFLRTFLWWHLCSYPGKTCDNRECLEGMVLNSTSGLVPWLKYPTVFCTNVSNQLCGPFCICCDDMNTLVLILSVPCVQLKCSLCKNRQFCVLSWRYLVSTGGGWPNDGCRDNTFGELSVCLVSGSLKVPFCKC